MRAGTSAIALVAAALFAGGARAQVCTAQSNFNVVQCTGFTCPANSNCAANNTCTCRSGYTGVDCDGASCTDVACDAPDWRCVANTACGSSTTFNVVRCASGGWCPLNSTCSGSLCQCDTGYEARTCAGAACNGGCSAPNYWCAPTGGAGGGGGTGGSGGTGGTGGSGGGSGATTCEIGKKPTLASCGGDVCSCSAACVNNSDCNSGCCRQGYCTLSCVCSGSGTVQVDCRLGGAGGGGGGGTVGGGPEPRWGCAVSGSALLPLFALWWVRRRVTRAESAAPPRRAP